MNPFSQPKNYDEMLTKIMTYTFCTSLALVALVAHNWPFLWNFLHPSWLTFDIEPLGLKNIPPSYVILAFLISFAARVSKLHNRVSNLLGIRERFDINEILAPLAAGAGVLFDLKLREKCVAQRSQIMPAVFYKYASSTKPVIDEHLIWRALDTWSWFWICIETIVVAAVALIMLISIGQYKIGAWIGIAVFVGTLIATQINRACTSAAHAQVREILTDGQRRNEIGASFRAL